MPRTFTPASSAALDEMALTQIFTTISRRRYQAVGIIASNPFDTVFLARRVHRFCPNLRIFTTQADLLFARPQNVTDLRMLVASTYSLYPANQWIITPHEAQSHVLFSNQGAQGLYNAVTAHLWEMGISATATARNCWNSRRRTRQHTGTSTPRRSGSVPWANAGSTRYGTSRSRRTPVISTIRGRLPSDGRSRSSTIVGNPSARALTP